MITIKEIYQNTVKNLERADIEQSEARIEAKLLIEKVFGYTPKDLLLNPYAEIRQDQADTLEVLIEKRVEEKVPVQYLINRAYFMGQEFYVDENVLIPRPETEILVEEVINLAPEKARIIDVGTGSGCIGIMLAKIVPHYEVVAADISKGALSVAKQNAKQLGVEDRITFIQSDIFENIKGKFDVIVSNPPYISIKEKETLQKEVVGHEPHSALFVEDEQGVSFYEKLAELAASRLNPGGYLAVEIGASQAEVVKAIFGKNGFSEVQVKKDFAEIERVVIGKLLTQASFRA